MDSILNEKLVLLYRINNWYSLIQIFQNVRSRSIWKILCFFLFAFLTERIFWKISAPSLKFNFVLPLSEVIKKSNSPTYWHVRRKTQLFVRKFTPLAHLLVFSRFTASKSSTKLKWSIKVMSHLFSSSAKFSSFLTPWNAYVHVRIRG